MNHVPIVIIRLQYQRRPEGDAGFEDTTSFSMRAAVRIREAFKPKFSEPFRLLRSLIPMALALFKPRKQPSCISAKVHNLSAPFVAPAFHEHQHGAEHVEIVRERIGEIRNV